RLRLDRIGMLRGETAVSAEPVPIGTAGAAGDEHLEGRRGAAAPNAVASFSRNGGLRVPIDGVQYESFKGGFAEKRDGHQHEAVDILAPRNTPVHAAEDGISAKLFVSKAGGNTIYQFDRDGRLCFYYAHLE